MTETKRQSAIQPEQIQGFNSSAEDELSLIDLLKFLARKKVFILAVTSACALFSIFYAQSITPIYRTTVGLLDHNEGLSSFSTLEQLNPELAKKVSDQTIKPLTIFERFLFNIKSYELKQEVFVNGGFQKKFSRETGIDTDQSVVATYNSTKIVKGDGTTYLELEGTKPKVMLEFLTALVEAAKENVNTEINDLARSIFKTGINNLSTEIEVLHQKITLQKQVEKEKKALQKQVEKEEKAKEIVRLSKALAIAKRMGIKNNNFAAGNEKFPLWFQYGELALQQEINILRSKQEETPNTKNLSIEKLNLKRLEQKITSLRRTKENPNTKNLSIKKRQLKRIQNADLPLLKFKVATISKYSYKLTTPNQTRKIIGFGVAFGLVIGILMAFIIDLKQLKAKEIPSAPK